MYEIVDIAVGIIFTFIGFGVIDKFEEKGKVNRKNENSK